MSLSGTALAVPASVDSQGLTGLEVGMIAVLLGSLVWVVIGTSLFYSLKHIVQRLYPSGDCEVDSNPEPEVVEHGADAGAAGTGASNTATGTTVTVAKQEHLYFCYACADFRPLKDAAAGNKYEKQGLVRMGAECSVCDNYMVHHMWLPHLLEFFLEYDNAKYGALSKQFPLRIFVTKTEMIVFLTQIISGIFNILTVIYKLYEIPTRNRDQNYNITMIVLPWTEFVAVVIFFLMLVFNALRVVHRTKHGPLHGHIRPFLMVFFVMFPPISNVNSFGMVRCWDVRWVLNMVRRRGTVVSTAPACTTRLLGILFWFAMLPLMLFLWFLPAAAVFTRLLQLGTVMETYVANWNTTQWITFLGFLNNIRSVAVKVTPLSGCVRFLIGDNLYVPFIDMVACDGGWLTIAALLYTSAPQELYRIFLDNSDLVFPATKGDPHQPHGHKTKLFGKTVDRKRAFKRFDIEAIPTLVKKGVDDMANP